MKKIVTLLLVITFGLSLMACGKASEGIVKSSSDGTDESFKESVEESSTSGGSEESTEVPKNYPVTLPDDSYEVDSSLREMLEAHMTEIEEAGFMVETLLEKEWTYEATSEEYSCKFTQGNNDYVIIVNPDRFDIAELPVLGGTSSGTESNVETQPDATIGTSTSAIDFNSYIDVYPEGDERLWSYEAVDVTGFPHMDTCIEKLRKDNGWTTVEVVSEFFDDATGDAEFEILFDGFYRFGFAIDHEGTRYVKDIE